MAELVANTYSEALFEVALEMNNVDGVQKELQFIVDSFNEYPEFFELFNTPKLNIEERKGIICEVYENKISAEMLNFLKVILDKKRGSEIISIRRAYDKRVDVYKGIVKVVVESAVDLDDNRKKELVEKLTVLTNKQVDVTYNIDKDILGGLVIKIEDKIIDGSVKSKLDDMLHELTQIIV